MRKVIIVGSNATAWIAALALRKQLNAEVQVIELKDATALTHRAESLPPAALQFHQKMQIDERELVASTNACFQLATHYCNAAQQDRETGKGGYDFVQGYAQVGVDFDGFGFQHYYKKHCDSDSGQNFEDYAIGCKMARSNKFVHPVNNNQSILSTIQYGLQVDTAKYAQYFKKLAQQKGVKRVFSESLMLNLESWKIASLNLDNKLELTADLYLDATDDGLLHRMLLSKTSDRLSLPCSKVLNFNTPSSAALSTNTLIQAVNSGYLKSTPLVNRMEHSFYFDHQISSEEDILAQAQALTSVNHLNDAQFNELNNECLESFWLANCVAIGGYAGNPCSILVGEIQLAHAAVMRLIELFPASDDHDLCAQEYNRIAQSVYCRLHEYQMVGFHLTYQPNSAFWCKANAAEISEIVKHKLAVLQQQGKVASYEFDPNADFSWLSLLLGFGVTPVRYDPLLDMQDTSSASQKMSRIKQIIAQTLPQLPSHKEYLQDFLHR